MEKACYATEEAYNFMKREMHLRRALCTLHELDISPLLYLAQHQDDITRMEKSAVLMAIYWGFLLQRSPGAPKLHRAKHHKNQEHDRED